MIPLSQPQIRSWRPPHLHFCLAVPVHPVLQPQPGITASLEDATHFECPRHLVVLAQEKKPHLHGVACEPVSQHGEAEPLAGARACIGKDLRERQRGFNGEPEVADEKRVWGGWGGVEYGVKSKENEG